MRRPRRTPCEGRRASNRRPCRGTRFATWVRRQRPRLSLPAGALHAADYSTRRPSCTDRRAFVQFLDSRPGPAPGMWRSHVGVSARSTWLWSQEEAMALTIGDTAPDFDVMTTEGRISFHDWMGKS